MIAELLQGTLDGGAVAVTDIPQLHFTTERGFAAWLSTEGQEYIDYENTTYSAWEDCVSDVYGVALYVEGTDIDDDTLDRLGAYYFQGPFAGEYWGSKVVEVGNGKLVFYSTDFTKSRHDDTAWFLSDTLWVFFSEGSPVRKTDRTGPKGTRAVEGLGNRKFYFAFED
jgi:hypothetical protein